MTSISLADPANHTLADATLVSSNNALIEGVINGNIDNGNVAAGANVDGSKLADGTVTNAKLVSSAGVLASMPPGRQLSYVEFTSPVNVAGVSEAAPTTVVTAAAVTFDGVTPVLIEFYSPSLSTGVSASCTFCLYDGASSIGLLGITSIASSTIIGPRASRLLTPSNASHTYSIRAFRVNNDCTVGAGTGGLGNTVPGYIRITKA